MASSNRLLEARQIETHWTNRGGGCLLHCPGQLAIYPILPLRWHDFSLGEYLQRFQAALTETLTELGVQIQPQPGRYGVWGRTGQIAALGVAVRDWVTWHGAYLNVSPALGLFRLVESDPQGQYPMGSIAAERCGVVRMATVRAVLVRQLTEAFGCDRYHLYTGHPWLKSHRADKETPHTGELCIVGACSYNLQFPTPNRSIEELTEKCLTEK